MIRNRISDKKSVTIAQYWDGIQNNEGTTLMSSNQKEKGSYLRCCNESRNEKAYQVEDETTIYEFDCECIRQKKSC